MPASTPGTAPDTTPKSSAAEEEDLDRAGVEPEDAPPAYKGVPLIQAERLLTPEEEAMSFRMAERRDRPGTLRLVLALNVGVILCAVAYVFFQAPNNLATGGASGLAIVIASLVPGLSSDAALWIVNVALVVIGLIFVEKRAVFWSVVASIALSAYASLLQWLVPVTGSITGDLWIDLVCSIALCAVGSGIAYNAGASTGGTDILVMALARHTSLPTGHAVTVANAVTACAGVALYGPRVGTYCIVGLLLETVVVNGVLNDLKQHKVCLVISREPARVQEFVARRLARTSTVWIAYGSYSGKEVTVVMTVLTRNEAKQLEKFLDEVDTSAFVTYVNTSQITGEGFRWV